MVLRESYTILEIQVRDHYVQVKGFTSCTISLTPKMGRISRIYLRYNMYGSLSYKLHSLLLEGNFPAKTTGRVRYLYPEHSKKSDISGFKILGLAFSQNIPLNPQAPFLQTKEEPGRLARKNLFSLPPWLAI